MFPVNKWISDARTHGPATNQRNEGVSRISECRFTWFVWTTNPRYTSKHEPKKQMGTTWTAIWPIRLLISNRDNWINPFCANSTGNSRFWFIKSSTWDYNTREEANGSVTALSTAFCACETITSKTESLVDCASPWETASLTYTLSVCHDLPHVSLVQRSNQLIQQGKKGIDTAIAWNTDTPAFGCDHAWFGHSTCWILSLSHERRFHSLFQTTYRCPPCSRKG